MLFIDDGGGGPALEGGGDVIMPVALVLDGEEQLAGFQRARIDGYAGEALGHGAEHARFERTNEAKTRPEKAAHAPCSCKAARAASISEKANTSLPTICPV